jgi:hypothetical protein
LKIKDRIEFVWQKRTDFGVEKVPFLGKKRSLLIFNEAISSLFTPFQEAENGTAEARQASGSGGEAPFRLQAERTVSRIRLEEPARRNP